MGYSTENWVGAVCPQPGSALSAQLTVPFLAETAGYLCQPHRSKIGAKDQGDRCDTRKPVDHPVEICLALPKSHHQTSQIAFAFSKNI